MSWRDRVREEILASKAYEIPHPPNVRAKLDANECAWPIDVDWKAALSSVELHRYPDGHASELRRVVARRLGVAGEQIVFGNGSDEMIALLIATFARPRPGRARARVAFPWPSFVVYRIAAIAHGAEPVELPLRPDFTLGSLDAARDANVVFFALPNNPTGTLWPLAAVLEFTAANRDVLVVADEAYVDYSGETVLGALAQHENLIVMRTLSKIGLAGLRVGFTISSPEIAKEIEKIRPPYNLGSVNQAVAAWMLDTHGDRLAAHAARVVAERERIAPLLAAKLELETFPTRANLLLVRHPRATALWEQLAAAGVLVRNFDRPGPLAGCLRITVGTPAENDLLLGAL
jgi:histidinol-phosphate aminotransferase